MNLFTSNNSNDSDSLKAVFLQLARDPYPAVRAITAQHPLAPA